MQKLSIKECNYLLLNKSVENKKVFLEGFIPCVQKSASFLYDKYHSFFTGSYDYEDLVNDSFLVAADLYDSFIPNHIDIAYYTFEMVYAKSVRGLLKNTFFFTASTSIIDKIADLEKIKEEYYEKYGVFPDYKTSLKIGGYKYNIDKPILRVSFNDANLGSYEIEGDILNNIINDNMHDIIVEKLQELSSRDQMIICLIFGLFGNKKHTFQEVGDMFHITKQSVHCACKRFYLKFKHDLPETKKFIKE